MLGTWTHRLHTTLKNGHVLGDHMTDKLDQDLPKGRIKKKKKTLKDFAAHTLAVTVAFISTAFITVLWNVRA